MREERGTKPFLKRFWKPEDPNNYDPRVTFRWCRPEKPNLRRARKTDGEYLDKVEQELMG
jgi:hypothetical protein